MDYQLMIDLLSKEEMSVRDISDKTGISEKEVRKRLSYIACSLDSQGKKIIIRPARCRVCGYASLNRMPLSLPERCRMCKKAPLDRPAYRIC